MLTLRLQRTGRSGHAQFRLIAQDRRFSPSSGRVTAHLGSYDPHTKKADLDAAKIAGYLKNGAQPSPRVIKLLKSEGIKLPVWVSEPAAKKRSVKNLEKLRKNRPAEPKAEADKPAEEADGETQTEEVKTEAEPAVEAAVTELAPEVPAPEAEIEPTQTAEPEPTPE